MRLLAALRERTHVTLLEMPRCFALNGSTALLHRIEGAKARVASVAASRTVLATAASSGLPIFAGIGYPASRHRSPPTISPSAMAWRMAGSAIVAMRAISSAIAGAPAPNDAGVEVKWVADIRLNPQSRFVDFAKAGGLTLAGGESPVAVYLSPHAEACTLHSPRPAPLSPSTPTSLSSPARFSPILRCGCRRAAARIGSGGARGAGRSRARGPGRALPRLSLDERLPRQRAPGGGAAVRRRCLVALSRLDTSTRRSETPDAATSSPRRWRAQRPSSTAAPA